MHTQKHKEDVIDLVELVMAVENSKWLIKGLLKVMLEDSVGTTQEDRETIVSAGVKVISDILDTNIMKNYKGVEYS